MISVLGVGCDSRNKPEKQENEDKERLDKLYIALNLRNTNPRNLDLSRYQHLLEDDFPQRTLRVGGPIQMTRDRLGHDEMFRHWMQAGYSCILHLSGQNWTGSNNNSTLLWLSPAVHVVAEQRRSAQAILAYFLCQVSYHVRKNERSYIQSLACSVIHQLVSHRPEILRSGELSRSLQASLQGDFTEVEEEDIALDRMKNCILGVLGHFRKEDEVFLIIDRPDQCYCGKEEITARETLINLLQIVLDAPCLFKILIVTRATWLATKQADRLEGWLQKEQKSRNRPADETCYLYRQHWNQESERERSMSPSSI